jgi:hypothetical protein
MPKGMHSSNSKKQICHGCEVSLASQQASNLQEMWHANEMTHFFAAPVEALFRTVLAVGVLAESFDLFAVAGGGLGGEGLIAYIGLHCNALTVS